MQLQYQVETNNGSLQLGCITQEWQILHCFFSLDLQFVGGKAREKFSANIGYQTTAFEPAASHYTE